jgi:hypothetical protein
MIGSVKKAAGEVGRTKLQKTMLKNLILKLLRGFEQVSDMSKMYF